jgi:enoyl-CoA hydratase/carnithine racemase
MIAISELVRTKKVAPSGTIILNRPECRNALSREMVAALIEALDDYHQERGVRAVILTGAGESFCSGWDLQTMHDLSSEPNAQEIWHEDVRQFQQLIETMLRFPKPIIAAVNGWVAGSGAALMLAADLAIAGTSAQLLMPEARRGLSCGLTAPLMAFRIGAGPTANVLFRGMALAATRAHELGLYQEVVDDALVWARCHEVAKEIAIGSSGSHQLTKQLLNETIGESLLTQLSIGAANTAAARTTQAAREGIAAFLEKRPPDWQ